jgi:hypothetical protein
VSENTPSEPTPCVADGMFYCEVCRALTPKMEYWPGYAWIDRVELFGKPFQAGKCQICGHVMVWPKVEA